MWNVTVATAILTFLKCKTRWQLGVACIILTVNGCFPEAIFANTRLSHFHKNNKIFSNSASSVLLNSNNEFQNSMQLNNLTHTRETKFYGKTFHSAALPKRNNIKSNTDKKKSVHLNHTAIPRQMAFLQKIQRSNLNQTLNVLAQNNLSNRHSISTIKNLNEDYTQSGMERNNNEATSLIRHPITAVQHVLQSVQDAMAGKVMLSNLIQSDESFKPLQKRQSHLLGDNIELPGDIPYPVRLHTLDGYPNPFKDPLACHRRHQKTSFVCDPDDVLGPESSNAIETILAKIKETCQHPCGKTFTDDSENNWKIFKTDNEISKTVPCQIAVAAVRSLPKDVSGTQMANYLLRKWDIGQPECQDGILVLYSKEDKKPFISWNKGEENRFNAHTYSSLARVFDTTFKNSPDDAAIIQSLSLIEMEQSGKVPQPRRVPQLLVLIGISITSGLLFCCCLIAQITSHLKSTMET